MNLITDKMSDDEYFEYFAGLLSRKLYMSKEFVKAQLYALKDDVKIEPWLQHIMLTEVIKVIVEETAMIKSKVTPKY